MADLTERDLVIKYFVDKGIHTGSTVDVAVALQRDKQERKELDGQKAYVDRVLKAGYKSKAAQDLLNDINSAKEPQPEPPQEQEPVQDENFSFEKE